MIFLFSDGTNRIDMAPKKKSVRWKQVNELAYFNQRKKASHVRSSRKVKVSFNDRARQLRAKRAALREERERKQTEAADRRFEELFPDGLVAV